MNIKQISSLVVAVIGVLLIAYGVHSRGKITKAETEIHQMAQSKNRIVKSLGQEMEKKIENYGSKTKWCFIGGSILIICGGGFAYMYRKKKRR